MTLKIRRFNIQSFGALSNLSYDFGAENMVLVYGDNESGKSTIAEFLRSTMFPGKNSKYPAAKKSDSGLVEVVMGDGDIRILRRDQRKVIEKDGKQLPSVDLHLDADTYRSLFGLDLEQLGNDKVITTGDLKRRFLTVPGAEHVPEVSKIIRAEMDNLMTKERVTDGKTIGKFRKEFKSLDLEIVERQADLKSYDKMVKELDALKDNLIYAHDAQDTISYNHDREVMLGVINGQVEEVNKLKAQRLTLAYAYDLTDDDVEEYDKLREDLRRLNEERMARESHLTNSHNPMTRERAEMIMSEKDRIENARGLMQRLELLGTTIADLKIYRDEDDRYVRSVCDRFGLSEDQIVSIGSNPEVRERLLNPQRKRTIPAKFAKVFTKGKRLIYTLVSVAGIAAGILVDSPVLAAVSMGAGIAVNVAPSVLDVYFHVDNVDWDVWIPEVGFPQGTTKENAVSMIHEIGFAYDSIGRRDLSQKRVEEFTAEYDAIVSTVNDVLTSVGLYTGCISGDMNELASTLHLAEDKIRGTDIINDVDVKLMEKQKEYDDLVGKFGGEERFQTMYEDRKKLIELDLTINALNRSIEQSTVNADNYINRPTLTAEDVEVEKEHIQDQIDSLNQRIGHLTAELAAVHNDEEFEELKVKRAGYYGKYLESIKRWAILSIADTIINECCDHFYSRLQPSVVRTANSYLSLMTCGRYQIIADPRSSDLTIEDRMGRKSLSEWSAGLGDQVLLSVKMAIAKELTDESVPFIMDDVLVRFDRERKKGACRAILEFAKDQQVIMFTCDRYLESAFKLENPSIKYIQL